MPTHSGSARSRGDEFLAVAGDFRLGSLVTEASHPRSTALSQVARADAAAGLAVLFDVDRDVIERFEAWSASDQPHAMAHAMRTALDAGGRLFFTGCGATGRLSIQLDAIWRTFWRRRRTSGLMTPDPDRWEERTLSVMAGGDYALVKAVEGFEDLVPFGRRQLTELGVTSRDVVCAITEGGETPFVIGTAWQGVDAGARVFFVYNNPDDVLRATVRRSREVIDESRITTINLTTGPMAITGSTRMQATSIQLLALTTVLEMVVRTILADAGALDPDLEPAPAVPDAARRAMAALHATLAGDEVRGELARLVEREERIYRGARRISYFADSLAIDVLTDTTERSPTFCTASFRKWDDPDASESWAFLFTPVDTTEAAWPHLLGRRPRTIEWTEADVRALLGPDVAARQLDVLQEIGHDELLRFRIGLDGLGNRPVRAGDGAVAILAEPDLPLFEQVDAPLARVMTAAREAGAEAALVVVGRSEVQARVEAAASRLGMGIDVALTIPRTRFLLEPLTRVGVKMLLNALSTCTMVRMGRVLGNRMIWVAPNNLKLVDRSIRYIRDLTGVSYEEACYTLFDVIEYVEPRRRAGQAFPAPVGLATMHLRHGLSLSDAEARLLAELG